MKCQLTDVHGRVLRAEEREPVCCKDAEQNGGKGDRCHRCAKCLVCGRGGQYHYRCLRRGAKEVHVWVRPGDHLGDRYEAVLECGSYVLNKTYLRKKKEKRPTRSGGGCDDDDSTLTPLSSGSTKSGGFTMDLRGSSPSGPVNSMNWGDTVSY